MTRSRGEDCDTRLLVGGGLHLRRKVLLRQTGLELGLGKGDRLGSSLPTGL